MLREMPSSEITEWMAYFDIQNNPQPKKELSPEKQSNLIKTAIFKGKKK